MLNAKNIKYAGAALAVFGIVMAYRSKEIKKETQNPYGAVIAIGGLIYLLGALKQK